MFFPPWLFHTDGQGCRLLPRFLHACCDFLCLHLHWGPLCQLRGVGSAVTPCRGSHRPPSLRHSLASEPVKLRMLEKPFALFFALLGINRDPEQRAGCPERQAGLERETRALSLTLPKEKRCFLYFGANNGHVINSQERLGMAVLLQERLSS